MGGLWLSVGRGVIILMLKEHQADNQRRNVLRHRVPNRNGKQRLHVLRLLTMGELLGCQMAA
jgi:hypothetical protein